MPSLTGWSAALFIAGGIVWILIGALAVPMMNTPAGRSTLIFSSATDTKAFGATPQEVLDAEPNVDTLRTVLLRILAGFLVVGGLMVVAVAWFGWRGGASWAYATLTATALLVLPFWYFGAKPILDAGAEVRFFDIPPFMWVPTALWAPAIALGALSMRGA